MVNTITECAVDFAAAVKREDKTQREMITGLLTEVSDLRKRITQMETDLSETVMRKQALDATIIVNSSQLTNMVFHELTAGLEGSGKICGVVQEFVSETVRTIMHDYVKDELEKMIPTNQALQKEVKEIIEDVIADHPQFSGKMELCRADTAVRATFRKLKQALFSADTTEDFGGKEKDVK